MYHRTGVIVINRLHFPPFDRFIYSLLFFSPRMANRLVIPFLVTMMILTGVCNTLLGKYQVCPLPLPYPAT